MRILVTGAAGFIGMHVAQRLLASGNEVVGIDNLNDYYDTGLKRSRLEQLQPHEGFRFIKLDIADYDTIARLFSDAGVRRVVHLAAQPGVRYSLKNPHAYSQSNLVGFLNILEACRHNKIEHLVYASSSSVYGGNARIPYSEHDDVNHPVSLYAATKRSNELMAHVYSHLFSLPVTGLRFFTVYGPWGRPDMSPSLFARAILEGKPIDVFNHGKMQRDFTFIDDVTEGVARILSKPAIPDPAFDPMRPDPATSNAAFRIYNIGNHQPVGLLDYIEAIEAATGRKAIKNFLPIQPGDVPSTFADTADLHQATGFLPATPLHVGIARFMAWFREYYKFS